MPDPGRHDAQVSFHDLPGWADDDHGQAFSAFRRSCVKIDEIATQRAAKGKPLEPDLSALTDICRQALIEAHPLPRRAARAFFERYFQPQRIDPDGGTGFVTGYFEPELKGAREASEIYHVPVLAKPDDLVALYPDAHRAAHNHELSAGRQTTDGVEAYATRQEIESGALAGRGLEILYLADSFDAFIMHVQGSGRVVLTDGSVVRLAYAAKNGHPYTSIGRILIERGEIAKDEMSLTALERWVRQHPDTARELMWQNRSYIFFRELQGYDARLGPVGAQGVALMPGRSLAVDGSLHDLGSPIWVEAPDLKTDERPDFRRLMVAQDVGSAIKGPQRGDIFWGSGANAGGIAGATRHSARFWKLVPRRARPNG